MADPVTAEQIYEFGAFRLDERRGTLVKGDHQTFLRPKAHTLLLHLARNMGRVVPKAELMDTVWPGIYVTEDSLTQSIREIRKAMGDSAQDIVRTVSRRGYMLAGGRSEEPQPIVASQPTVAVLRFRNDGGDPAREPLVDGFAEDIVNGIARFGSVTVLARNSSFQFASQDPAQWATAASRIGADYLVEGSIRWSGNGAVIAVSLIEVKSLRQLWGDSYQAADLEVFEVQREIGEQIVNRLVSRLDQHNVRQLAVKPAKSLAAYELVAIGNAAIRGIGLRRPAEAIACFEGALAKDPSYGLALANLALAKVMLAGYGRAPVAILEEAQDMSTRAIAMAPDQAAAPRTRSLARLYLRQYQGAENDMRMSLDINRYDADSVEQMGYLLILRGRPLSAIAWIERAMRLNPIYPEFYHYDRGLALYGLSEYQQAIDAWELPSHIPPWVAARLAAAYAQIGDGVRAKLNIEKAMAMDPVYDAIGHARDRMPYEHDEDAGHLVAGIEMAMKYAESP